MKRKLSALFAVTAFTLYIIVFSKRPCEVLKPVRSTKQMQPLSGAEKRLKIGYDKSKVKCDENLRNSSTT